MDDRTREELEYLAELIDYEFPDPNPLASIFNPYVGTLIVERIRRFAKEGR